MNGFEAALEVVARDSTFGEGTIDNTLGKLSRERHALDLCPCWGDAAAKPSPTARQPVLHELRTLRH